MNAISHRIAIAQRFASRIQSGDAVFQSPVDNIKGLPCTLSDSGDVRSMSGANLFVLLQVMKDRNYSDPRFFTREQADRAGWTVADDAVGVSLRYLTSTGADGMPLEKPVTSVFQVFNAEGITGVPAFERAMSVTVDDLKVAMERNVNGAWIETDGLSVTALNWAFDLQRQVVGNVVINPADMALRAKLAVSLLEAGIGSGFGNDAGPYGAFKADWIEGIESDPLSFFQAAKDAEGLAAQVMARAREVAIEREAVAQVAVSEEKDSADLAFEVALTAGKIARREDERSVDPRIDRILAREQYLVDIAKAMPEQAKAVAISLRKDPQQYSDYSGVPVDRIKSYASIIERQLQIGNQVVVDSVGAIDKGVSSRELMAKDANAGISKLSRSAGHIGFVAATEYSPVVQELLARRDGKIGIADVDRAFDGETGNRFSRSLMNDTPENRQRVISEMGVIGTQEPAAVEAPEVKAAAQGDDMTKKKLSDARMAARFEEREAVLAVPFADKERVKSLGAEWFGPQKLWFVPKGMDVEKFKEWNPREHGVGAVAIRADMVNSFMDAMQALGLDTSKGIIDDGKCQWHHVKVLTKRKNLNNKAGSYVVNFGDDGSMPKGMIMNKDTGESFAWKHEGELLTPEQRARMRAEALAREAVAAREAAVIQDAAAEHAAAIWAGARPADGHPYLVAKGIEGEGLRQVSGAVLLGYSEFKGESGGSMIRGDKHYLLVPMKNEAGDFRAVQAIGEDGSKSFMRGAQKKGTMMVMGADCFDDVLESGKSAVAYVEGLATGASFRAVSGLPVAVCFDAGNLETVTAQTAKAAAKAELLSVVAADNDQFHVERAMGFLSENLGLNPHADGQAVSVASGAGQLRRVALGEAIADGEWHQTAKGTYCATLEFEEGSEAVRRVKVEIVPTGGKSMRATFENRGIEAGRKAMEALEAAGGRVVMAVPAFESVQGRPTDWNDLHKREGIDKSRTALKVVDDLVPVMERELVKERPLERAVRAIERGRGAVCR